MTKSCVVKKARLHFMNEFEVLSLKSECYTSLASTTHHFHIEIEGKQITMLRGGKKDKKLYFVILF